MSSSDIVQQLRRLRVESKICQFDFAELTGYNRTQIALYETGKRTPNLATASDFADALGHQLVVVSRAVPTLKTADPADFILHCIELGFRGACQSKTLGEIVRECHHPIRRLLK